MTGGATTTGGPGGPVNDAGGGSFSITLRKQ